MRAIPPNFQKTSQAEPIKHTLLPFLLLPLHPSNVPSLYFLLLSLDSSNLPSLPFRLLPLYPSNLPSFLLFLLLSLYSSNVATLPFLLLLLTVPLYRGRITYPPVQRKQCFGARCLYLKNLSSPIYLDIINPLSIPD